MIIVRDRPPMFAEMVKAFPAAAGHGVLFAWGNRIYNPSGVPVSRQLYAHEEIHHQQQGDKDDGIAEWWRTYLGNKRFRFEQELPAHQAEYRAYRPGRSGFSRAGYLHKVASCMASDLYGGIVTYQEAVTLIKAEG